MATTAEVQQRRKAATHRRDGGSSAYHPEMRQYPDAKPGRRAKTQPSQEPVVLEYVDGRWLIGQSEGKIPASPWEIDLWQQLVEAREMIHQLMEKQL